MKNTKIDWCDHTWNPVTGCYHNCEYCYARKIANRFKPKDAESWLSLSHAQETDFPIVTAEENCKPYPCGFIPTFYYGRLDEPQQIKKPSNIFVCSMADLFGEWVPDYWIEKVFKACEEAPQHNYLFLTKNPKRYTQVLDKYFPPNMWFGWSQTGPEDTGFSTHHSVRTFLSLEPFHSPFDCGFQIAGIDWVIIGAETGNRKGKIIPEKEWVDEVVDACHKLKIPVFMKNSLREIMGNDFIQEFPDKLIKEP